MVRGLCSTYDGLGRITSVTTYRSESSEGDVIGYTYNEADKLSAITYPDGTKVSYEYDLNNNLIKVTDREGLETTYVYDAINRITEIHRPNGISTYNTYNANDRITVLENKCDDCEWVVSSYSYTYDERGFITGETAIESLAGYAYDDKHNGKHTDGKHDDLYPHGTKHAKHDKDATFAYQIVQTDRSFVYDDAGKLLSATETEDNYGTYIYTYEYDLMGNRTSMTKTASDGTVAEWHKYVYNDSNQLVSEELYNGKKTTSLSYTYDGDGNRITETGKIGTDKVNKTYTYTVENRLEAVYDADELLMAAAYDGDGNRVFQLNYNLHTDEDWKDNSGNGNGSNKDNSGNGKGNSKKNGNTSNAETDSSQNQSGILFPVDEEVSSTEEYLIGLISSTGKQKNYELIEYVNDVNREYTEVLVEQNINGKTDTAYVYGADRLSLDRFDGSTGYYLYDPRGSVAGITNEEGQIYQSYRYSVNGEITFGAPQYENEYTYNAESYNPNIQSQYLRARYYNVVSANFLTEDSYLGELMEPLTLNRYNYCSSNPVNYCDPSGQFWDVFIDVVSVVCDIVELVKEPSWENAGTLLADVALAVVPFAPAVTGTAVRTGKKVVNVATDAMSAANKMMDVGKVAEGAKATAEVIETVTDTGKAIENATEAIEIVDDISDTAKAFENAADAGSKLSVPGPDDFADDLMKSNAKSGDNYLIKNSEEALENAKTGSCKTADNLDVKGSGNVVDGGVESGSKTNFYATTDGTIIPANKVKVNSQYDRLEVEVYSGNSMRPKNATDDWDSFLGPNQTDIDPRTGQQSLD